MYLRKYCSPIVTEVECYRINRKKLRCEYKELWQIQHDIWKQELTLGVTVTTTVRLT